MAEPETQSTNIPKPLTIADLKATATVLKMGKSRESLPLYLTEEFYQRGLDVAGSEEAAAVMFNLVAEQQGFRGFAVVTNEAIEKFQKESDTLGQLLQDTTIKNFHL